MLKPPSLTISTKFKRIEPQRNEMVSFIYTNLPVNAIVRLPHLQSRDSQDQKTFLAPSTDKQSLNYDRVLKTLSLPINTNVKGIEP